MTHLAVFTPPYAGHFNPMLALAGGLVGRGHRVTFLAQADAAGLMSRPNIGFHPLGADSHPPGTLDRMAARLGWTTGLFGIGAVIADVARTTDMLCREAPAALRGLGVDAIIADQTEAAGGLLARHLGLPQISVANALLIDREPLIPPPFTDWAYDATEWGEKRNRGGYRVADWMMRPVRRVIGDWAARWSLGALASAEDCLSPILQISQTVESFDFPRLHPPSGLVHVGPLREPNRGTWAPAGTGGVVFCSLGTLQGGRLPIFRAVARACEALDLRLVLAHGGKLSAKQAESLPASAEVEAFLPQRAVLARAEAAVVHGGLNTVLDALGEGVPLVVVPIAFEQGAVGARVARSGAGVVLSPRFLTAAKLAAALETVLGQRRFRERAKILRDEIARAGGVSRGVDLIEGSVGGVR